MVYNGILFRNIKEPIVDFYTDNGKTWMSLKNIVLSERSQTQKTTYFIFSNSIYIKFLEKTKRHKADEQFPGAGGRSEDCVEMGTRSEDCVEMGTRALPEVMEML